MDKEWSQVRVILRQPYRKAQQFGLRFIKFRGKAANPPASNTVKTSTPPPSQAIRGELAASSLSPIARVPPEQQRPLQANNQASHRPMRAPPQPALYGSRLPSAAALKSGPAPRRLVMSHVRRSASNLQSVQDIDSIDTVKLRSAHRKAREVAKSSPAVEMLKHLAAETKSARDNSATAKPSCSGGDSNGCDKQMELASSDARVLDRPSLSKLDGDFIIEMPQPSLASELSKPNHLRGEEVCRKESSMKAFCSASPDGFIDLALPSPTSGSSFNGSRKLTWPESMPTAVSGNAGLSSPSSDTSSTNCESLRGAQVAVQADNILTPKRSFLQPEKRVRHLNENVDFMSSFSSKDKKPKLENVPSHLLSKRWPSAGRVCFLDLFFFFALVDAGLIWMGLMLGFVCVCM